MVQIGTKWDTEIRFDLVEWRESTLIWGGNGKLHLRNAMYNIVEHNDAVAEDGSTKTIGRNVRAQQLK